MVMFKNITFNLLVISSCLVLIIFLLFLFIFGFNFYNKVFRLSAEQVSNSLITGNPQCNSINGCELLPGDILIRRYITKRTKFPEKFLNPYFTHSAFYLGDNYLVEAIGKEKDNLDEIRIISLTESDWLDPNIESLVVIRPKNYQNKLNILRDNFIDISEDPNYIFGLPKEGQKRATCADLIFNQLLENNIIDNFSNTTKIITPDYLFWIMTKNKDIFEIVGSDIGEVI